MIINHSKKFIFVHCPKTGGSSIVVYLAPYLGPNDLQIGAWKDCMEAGIWPNRRFFTDLVPLRLPSVAKHAIGQRSLIMGANKAHKRLYRTKFRRGGNAFAHEIRAFDLDAWDSHFKFCFVRNPYERIYSYYRWHLRQRHSDKSETFGGFVRRMRDNPGGRIPDTSEMYMIDGEIAVDFIGRYENILTDMETICGTIGVPFNSSAFPHTKKGAGVAYRSQYDAEEKRIVETLCQRELELFGYSF